jgi:hypothetical protein
MTINEENKSAKRSIGFVFSVKIQLKENLVHCKQREMIFEPDKTFKNYKEHLSGRAKRLYVLINEKTHTRNLQGSNKFIFC